MPTRPTEPPRPARSNPFRVSRVEALRYRLSPAGWRRLLDAWAAHGHRGALVGPHGSGKTTLLDEIAARHASEGWRIRRLRFSTEQCAVSVEDRRTLDGLDRRHLVTVDGAEQLPTWTWWWLRRRLRPAGAVLVTSHRSGLLPTLHEHRTDPALLTELVDELAPELSAVLEPELATLHARHAGNLRECFFELYDRWAIGALRA